MNDRKREVRRVHIKMPVSLKRRIQQHAERSVLHRTMTDVVIAAVVEYLDKEKKT